MDILHASLTMMNECEESGQVGLDQFKATGNSGYPLSILRALASPAKLHHLKSERTVGFCYTARQVPLSMRGMGSMPLKT